MTTSTPGLLTVLVGDAIRSLQNGDTKGALIHLNLASQQLTLITNKSVGEIIKVLIGDSIKALQNGDTKGALIHLNLINQQFANPINTTSLTRSVSNSSTVLRPSTLARMSQSSNSDLPVARTTYSEQ